MLKFLNMLWKSRIPERISQDHLVMQRKYNFFRGLLSKNNAALETLTNLEHLLFEDTPFTLDHVVNETEALIGMVYEIAEDLNALSEGRYPSLFTVTETLGVAVLKDLVGRRKRRKSSLVIPLRSLSHDLADEVGGKAANLGEVVNRVGLPVPPGFAISAYACQVFMRQDDLKDRIARKLRNLDVGDTDTLIAVCDEICEMIRATPLPPEFARAIAQEADELILRFGHSSRFAVRSSATCEDSEASFAGQHATVLNVSAENIGTAYKEVVASTFSPRAVFYRRSRGYSEEDVIMAVLCVAMIDSRASGVMYTLDPNHPEITDVIISAAWGLGVSVVDGSGHTDFFRVDTGQGRIIHREIAAKEQELRLAEADGIVQRDVAEDLRLAPCLTDEQILALAAAGRKLEEHYGQPLDIEWAVDPAGRACILQARPLNPRKAEEGECLTPEPAQAVPADREVLLQGGATAAKGAAFGPAYILLSEHNLSGVPKGAILVARQTSPAYVPVMDRVRAIVTDVGSVTGHMASVAREFGLPTLVGTKEATTRIVHGQEITVDATARVIYRGEVPELLKERKAVNIMRGSPVYKATQEALKRIAPLNLLDPKKDNFTPEGCQTLHDVIRFAHEMSMREMFRLGDEVDDADSVAVRLKVGLPLNLYAVDLGQGLKPGVGRTAVIDDVLCVPFRALLAGMTHPGVNWIGSVGLSLGGVAAIMAESVFQDPTMDGRMGGPNYAVISDEYLNFNTRLGYHFAVIDTYCGSLINDNYITFSFKGGAADIARRSRRAGLISQILKRLGFKVETKGDMVRAELKKYDCSLIMEKLDTLGRLLGAVRLLDMVLADDGQVNWYVEEFLKGNYTFQRS